MVLFSFQPSGSESCVPLMPNVLRVFLENGQTRSFKYDHTTTVIVSFPKIVTRGQGLYILYHKVTKISTGVYLLTRNFWPAYFRGGEGAYFSGSFDRHFRCGASVRLINPMDFWTNFRRSHYLPLVQHNSDTKDRHKEILLSLRRRKSSSSFY